MTTDTLIDDPTLLSVLTAASTARQTCLDLLSLLSTTTSTTSSTADLSLTHQSLHASLSHLRSTHRTAIHASRTTKQLTSEARQEIDALHLHLQNLSYEQRHLRGEIAACAEYPHRHRELPLVELDELVGRKPELADLVAAAEAEVAVDGTGEGEGKATHELMVARIEDELAARRELEAQRAKLVKVKEALVKETNAKKEELGKFDAEAEKWIAGAEGPRKLLEARERKVERERERVGG